MNEKIIKFGKQNSLFGIITEPEPSQNFACRPCIIILNSGLIHRIGPYRMSTELARKLSLAGFIVFRFDLPGVGDNISKDSKLTYQQRILQDISSAMDAITKNYDVKRFVALGNCTGAINSHYIACADDRICGAVLMDAYFFATFKYWLIRIKEKSIKSFRILSLRFTQPKGNIQTQQENNEARELYQEGIDYCKAPTKTEIRDDLKILMTKDVKMLYIFTGGHMYLYNHVQQHRSAFRSVNFKANMEVCFLDKMDHIYTLLRDRRYLMDIIVSWMTRKFG